MEWVFRPGRNNVADPLSRDPTFLQVGVRLRVFVQRTTQVKQPLHLVGINQHIRACQVFPVKKKGAQTVMLSSLPFQNLSMALSQAPLLRN